MKLFNILFDLPRQESQLGETLEIHGSKCIEAGKATERLSTNIFNEGAFRTLVAGCVQIHAIEVGAEKKVSATYRRIMDSIEAKAKNKIVLTLREC